MKIIRIFVLVYSIFQIASAHPSDGIQRLLEASCDRNIPLMKSTLEQGVNPNDFYQDNFPLMGAAVSQYPKSSIEAINLLINAGADPNLQNVYGRSALMFVVDHYWIWNPEVAQVLVSRGAQLDLRNRDGETALMLATFRPEAVDFLIKAGANPNIQTNDGYTPLMRAIWNMQNDAATCLQSFDIILGANPNLEIEMVPPPLYLEDGVRTALDLAVRHSNKEIVKKLLNAGAKIDGNQRSALIAATMADNKYEIAELLINAGAQINFKDQFGNTPLIYSVRKNDGNRLFNLIFEKGALLDIQNKDGNTALILAAYENARDSVLKLLKAGANPNIQGKNGETAMMQIANYGASDITLKVWHEFIDAGANLNLQDINGETILMKMVGHCPSVELFIKAGANVNLRNHEGKTALGLAREYSARKALIEAGGVE